MEVVIVVCHPRSGSLCHAVAARCAAELERLGRRVHRHDLYAEGLDPVLTTQELDRGWSFDEQIQRYGEELLRSSGLVLVFPDWWGQPPALLKGWLDRVLRPGVAYEFEPSLEPSRRRTPLLRGKKAAVFCTTDAEAEPAWIEPMWRDGVFAFCGIGESAVRVFADVRGSSYGGRQRWLDEAAKIVSRMWNTAAPPAPPAPPEPAAPAGHPG